MGREVLAQVPSGLPTVTAPPHGTFTVFGLADPTWIWCEPHVTVSGAGATPAIAPSIMIVLPASAVYERTVPVPPSPAASFFGASVLESAFGSTFAVVVLDFDVLDVLDVL